MIDGKAVAAEVTARVAEDVRILTAAGQRPPDYAAAAGAAGRHHARSRSGVGPMTIAMLMANSLKARSLRQTLHST